MSTTIRLTGMIREVSLTSDKEVKLMLGIKRDPKAIFYDHIFVNVTPEQARTLAPGDAIVCEITMGITALPARAGEGTSA